MNLRKSYKSKKKLLFRSNMLSNSEPISENLLNEGGEFLPIDEDIVTENTKLEEEISPDIDSNIISEKFSGLSENYHTVNHQIIREFSLHSLENNFRESETVNPNLIERVYDIFFELLDDDKQKKTFKDIDKSIANFILKYINYTDISVLLKTENQYDIDAVPKKARNIINLHRINDIRFINKFFESVNNKLKQGGIFIGCVETFLQRKKRILIKIPAVLSIPYYTIDFIFKRVFPKFCLSKKLYFSITHGKSRLLSLAETLGRLASCGFEILGYDEINNQTYFAAKRISKPDYDNAPTYGFVIRLKRIGKNGKIINVYKFRTMHPFSEYLQKYIYDNNNIKEGGKFKNDFRITPWGRVLRKYRLDELPMLWNFLKGDLKFFGIRPLSFQYYNMYEEDIRNRRIKYKPGLIPPFYADLPMTFKEITDSERRYLDNYDRHPFMADWKYFWKVMYNINIKHVMGE